MPDIEHIALWRGLLHCTSIELSTTLICNLVTCREHMECDGSTSLCLAPGVKATSSRRTPYGRIPSDFDGSGAKYLHHFIPKMVDDLYRDAPSRRFIEGARGVAVQSRPGIFVDFGL